MPNPTDRLHLNALVDHGAVEIVDDAGGRPPLPDFTDLDRWLYVGDNSVLLVSTSSIEHLAAVTIETWQSEPPADPSGWETREDADLVLASGRLEVDPAVAGENGQALRVGSPGRYQLRAYAAGRNAVLDWEIATRETDTPQTDTEPPNLVERFLLQLWPL